MKKIRVSLLTKVVIAIAAGVLFGQFLPGGIARIFVTQFIRSATSYRSPSL